MGGLGEQEAQRPTEHDRHEDPALVVGELVVDGPVERGDNITQLGDRARIQSEAVRQPVPVLGVHGHRRLLPEVAADLGRHLEDGELAGPGGEPALARGTGRSWR